MFPKGESEHAAQVLQGPVASLREQTQQHGRVAGRLQGSRSIFELLPQGSEVVDFPIENDAVARLGQHHRLNTQR